MQASEAAQLRHRAVRVMAGSIPASVACGGICAVQGFKSDLAVIAGFVRRGTSADKAKLAVLRLEGMQGARGAVDGGTRADGAARSATPPSNTGVNDGRQWLLGSGL